MKNVTRIAWVVAVLFCFALIGAGLATAEEDKAQETCPVMGGEINKNVYADYQGKRIYFCCAACIDLFKKDPEKYLKKLEEEGVQPEKTPAPK